MEFKRKGPVAQEEIDDLSNNERRKNISSNPFLVAHHFHSRVTTILSYLKTSQSLGKYRVKDLFYRVEFQLRGKIALHLTQASKTYMEDTVIRNYALREEGKFVNFDTVEFAEECVFPHLFPKGAIYLNYFL